MATVVVGMSGGVDSSVAALLLQQEGHCVIGLFMKNWEDSVSECSAEEDLSSVARVCEQLSIPYYAVNFCRQYKERVFSHFVEGYRAGQTPNPDILCNREIKFDLFLKKALSLGADYIATGHYCRNVLRDKRHGLLKGCDFQKDQSYFLYTLSHSILEKVHFPLGNLTKQQVRKIAKEHNLFTATKKESMGICFIGKKKFASFLSQYIKPVSGDLEDVEGKKVGKHFGMAYYTIGQRSGLGIGGAGEPWFVVQKDPERNVVIVAQGTRHPALYADQLMTKPLHWISAFKQALPCRLTAKIRYRQQDQPCIIESIDRQGCARVTFPIPQRAMAVGQSVVFYRDDHCLGGAEIARVMPSFYERQEPLPAVIAK